MSRKKKGKLPNKTLNCKGLKPILNVLYLIETSFFQAQKFAASIRSPLFWDPNLRPAANKTFSWSPADSGQSRSTSWKPSTGRLGGKVRNSNCPDLFISIALSGWTKPVFWWLVEILRTVPRLIKPTSMTAFSILGKILII